MSGGDREVEAPTVSVCIPTLGRASLYSCAVPSVLAQLEHLHQIVIGVHGADLAIDREALDDPRISTVRYTGPTVSGVRNAAAAAATGDLLVFLDDDDALATGALERFRRLFDDPRRVFASGAVEVHHGDGSLARVAVPQELRGLYRDVTANFLAGSFAVRRCLFDHIGGYNEALAFGENYDLGIRIAASIRDGHLGYDWTDEVVVHVAPSGNRYRDERAAAAAFTLHSYPELLAGLPRQRATLHAILGVYHWRQRDRRVSRAHLRSAVRAWPRDLRHVLRLVLSAVPPVADRRWRP
jgi:glycosyltransferase involved in cell wall biosynthesis